MTSTFSIYLAGFAMSTMVRCQPAPDKPPPDKPAADKVAQGPELERLIQDLIADDAKVAREAQDQLKKMGPEVVPVLFDRLVASGWDLKPPLLELLGYHGLGTHGLNWAKKKLLQGTDAEKTYAALLYELIDRSNHQDTPEFAAMVEVLLKALDTEDKHLRAAAAFALVHGQETTVFFEHFHRIVPALISSFDTDLCVWRGGGDPSACVLVGIPATLDCLIGDRMAYTDSEPTLFKGVQRGPEGKSNAYARRALAKWLATQPPELQRLRAYWTEWWDAHKHMRAAEIGKLIIERDLRLLEERKRASGSALSEQHEMFAEASLDWWTRGLPTPVSPDELWGWWEQHKSNYRGPETGGD